LKIVSPVRGPSGQHLVDLIRHSDDVLEVLLILDGLSRLWLRKFVDVRNKVAETVAQIDTLMGERAIVLSDLQSDLPADRCSKALSFPDPQLDFPIRSKKFPVLLYSKVDRKLLMLLAKWTPDLQNDARIREIPC
jgi:hypothetical protein